MSRLWEDVVKAGLLGIIMLVAVTGMQRSYAAGKSQLTSEYAPALATPLGITMRVTMIGGGPGGGRPGPAFFADARGETLYTYDVDLVPGKSACESACAIERPPVLADKKDIAVGEWTLIVRSDGSRQWAYRGKPVYTFAKSAGPDDRTGNSGPWHTVMVQSIDPKMLPAGISAREVPDAGAEALTDARGFTLYLRKDDSGSEKLCALSACNDYWLPLSAPAAANDIGDFRIVNRSDGTRQWAYKGQSIYTFTGDLLPGDANGVGDGWRVATILQYYMPVGTAIGPTSSQGAVLTTSKGKTLYRRDIHHGQNFGHALRRGELGIPALGRAVGTSGCDAACLADWRPLAAPSDARPSGYWSVLTRADGSKQWAYRDYALYTYVGDKKPGDINGHDIYDMVFNEKSDRIDTSMTDILARSAGAMAWVWYYMAP